MIHIDYTMRVDGTPNGPHCIILIHNKIKKPLQDRETSDFERRKYLKKIHYAASNASIQPLAQRNTSLISLNYYFILISILVIY